MGGSCADGNPERLIAKGYGPSLWKPQCAVRCIHRLPDEDQPIPSVILPCQGQGNLAMTVRLDTQGVARVQDFAEGCLGGIFTSLH